MASRAAPTLGDRCGYRKRARREPLVGILRALNLLRERNKPNPQPGQRLTGSQLQRGDETRNRSSPISGSGREVTEIEFDHQGESAGRDDGIQWELVLKRVIEPPLSG